MEYKFIICIFTAWFVEGWYKNQRTEFGRLRNEYGHLPSGSAAPKKLKPKSRKYWRWQVFMYMWDHITPQNVGQDTEVGICI